MAKHARQPVTNESPALLFSQEATLVATGLVVTAAIGLVAWSSPVAAIAVLFIPQLMNLLERRWWPWLIGFVYMLAGNYELPSIIARFFGADTSFVVTLGAPLALTAIQSLPFLLYRADRSPSQRGLRMAGVLALLTIPPIGLVAWRNPLLVSGLLFPGAGYLGLTAGIALFACLAGGGISFRRERRVIAAAGLLAAVVSVGALLHHRANPAPPFLRWVGIDTHLPPPDMRNPLHVRDEVPGGILADLTKQYMTPAEAYIDIIVFPESVFDPMTPADHVAFMPAIWRAKKHGVVMLVGATVRSGPGRWRNTVRAFGAMQGVVDEARVPMPMGNWRIGSGVTPRLLASDMVRLDTRHGPVMAAMSICFEDTVIWPHFGLLSGRAGVMVSMANTWATGGTRGDSAQTTSAKLLARLGGVPLVRAVNSLESADDE